MAPRSTGSAEWEDFLRPSLAVDVAVLTVEPRATAPRLALLILRREPSAYHGWWDIPGTFVHERERLPDAVRRALSDKAGVSDLQPVELGVFDDPDRDPRGWVISIAYTLAVPYSRLEPALKGDRAVQLVPVTRSQASPAAVHLPDGQPALPFDHQAMVERAVTTLRDQYAQRADPHRLLERTPFTLTELRRTHEAIAGHPFQRDAFARRVYPAEVQETTGRRDDTGGRPATLYHLRDSAAG